MWSFLIFAIFQQERVQLLKMSNSICPPLHLTNRVCHERQTQKSYKDNGQAYQPLVPICLGMGDSSLTLLLGTQGGPVTSALLASVYHHFPRLGKTLKLHLRMAVFE